MAAPTTAAAQTNQPDPAQDRQPTTTGTPTRTGRLLNLVRALIDYGKNLAATLQQRTPTTDLTDVAREFGTRDIALILARITRGLLRAAALEAKLTGLPDNPPPAPAARAAPSPRQPRATRPAPRRAADPRLASLPTPEDIAAEVRRRPIGAVIADICRDLGIVPSNPLWFEISRAILLGGGNLASLVKDTRDRHFAIRHTNPPAIAQPGQPPPHQPSVPNPGTGPP